MIVGTHWARNASACASPPAVPVTHGASWPSLHRSGTTKENAGVALARARSPGSGRNETMCAAQKARDYCPDAHDQHQHERGGGGPGQGDDPGGQVGQPKQQVAGDRLAVALPNARAACRPAAMNA